MEVTIRLLTAAIFLLLHIVVSLSSIPPINSTQSPLCRPSQSIALLQFKNHFFINKSACEYSLPTIDTWREGTDCCFKWEGVECDESSGNVISLHLSGLCRQFPTNSSLFQLSHLQKLSLSFNDFKSSPVPSELGRLVNLTNLWILDSGFSGMIPSQISHLSNLISLYIEGHDLIFDSLIFEMLSKNLTRLKSLSLHQVNMSAVNLKLFLNLSASLEQLRLYDCLLQGKFPVNFFRFVNLEYFALYDNPKLTITLPKSNWSGPLETLKVQYTRFSTQPVYSVAKIKSLKSLSLNGCGLRGSIPSFIFNLTQITDLDLRDNNLTGEIPKFLSNLKQLTSLSLSANNLKGQVPNFFGNLTVLSSLYLESNNLEGHLPSSIFNHPQLSTLYLSYNKLVSLPSNVSGISKLRQLFLDSNKLTGSIPSWLFNLSSLTDLDLSSNSFFFGIQELYGFQKLQNLNVLDLSYNSLSIPTLNTDELNWPKLNTLCLSFCNISEFPSFLRNQDKLGWLDLSHNNIRGDIPNWVLNIGKETMWLLDLSHNHLTGTLQLPWKNLELVDLHSNMLQGLVPIPPPQVSYFLISENNFSGEVSPLICDLSSLQVLDLSHNSLSGTIPSCLGNLTTSLLVLNLQRNSFHGMIPATFAEECALRNLNLQGNQLEGVIPSSLVNCKDLEVLDLGNNRINDVFPQWLESLPMLEVLIIRSNELHGPLPNFRFNGSFSKLQVLDLSNNGLVGRLPNIHNLGAMVNVDDRESASRYLGTSTTRGFIRAYEYSVTLSVKGNMIEMEKIFHVFTSIDFSNNLFEGEIPVHIGKLISLKGLNLSHNILTGRIPPSIGSLKNLESLDLSANKLIGEIPKQLLDVTSLSILNLSTNQLVGHIPEGKQFNTFTINSYTGNLGLCGIPMPRKCRKEKQKPLAGSIEDENLFFDHGFGWQAVIVGCGFGFIFGAGMGYIIFRYRRPRWFLLIIEDKLGLRQEIRNLRISRARRS